jgi:Flp pilus assembly protein TadD
LIRWMPVRAKIEARHGARKDAMALVTDAVHLAQTTDALNCHAKTRLDLGEVLLMAGRAEEASTAFSEALELYDEKGNVVAVDRARSLLDDLALV